MPYDTVEVENELKASTSAVRALNPMLFVGHSCDITSIMGNNHVFQLRNVGNTLYGRSSQPSGISVMCTVADKGNANIF